MGGKLSINAVNLDKTNNVIRYNYSYDSSIAKYFQSCPKFYAAYNVDLSNVPPHISIIPLLAQLLPIAWFGNFSIDAKFIDGRFYNSTRLIKSALLSNFKVSRSTNDDLNFEQLIDDSSETIEKSLLLYSGGVDSVSSYLLHKTSHPDVATIFGADITLNNHQQWTLLKSVVNESPLLSDSKKYFIESNLRDFYSYEVPLLIPDRAWWGRVQHGLGLTGLLAPIAYLEKHKHILISSSYSSNSNINWGSSPETDNVIRMGNTTVVHDSFEIRRVEKIKIITDQVKTSNQPIILRVCYSSRNTAINCSHCEKCYRTILGLIINNADPNEYGFKVTRDLYGETGAFVSKGFYSDGEAYFWSELAQSIMSNQIFFSFESPEKEKLQLKELAGLILTQHEAGVRRHSPITLMRQKIQLMFPKVTRALVQLRNIISKS